MFVWAVGEDWWSLLDWWYRVSWGAAGGLKCVGVVLGFW